MIPSAAFRPGETTFQRRHLEFQRTLASGWNAWRRDNFLAYSLLPDGVEFSIALFQPQSGKRLTSAKVSYYNPDNATMRAGTHLWDHSFTEIASLTWLDTNIRIRAARDGEEDYIVLVDVVSLPSDQ